MWTEAYEKLSIARKYQPKQRISGKKHEKYFTQSFKNIWVKKIVGCKAKRSPKKRLIKINDSFSSVRFDCVVQSFFFQPCILMPHSRKLCDAGEIIFWANTAFLCSNFLLLFFFLCMWHNLKSCNLVTNNHIQHRHTYT